MLLANLEIRLHEQTRLQPEIELTLAELVALVERFGGAGTDWSLLEQRMGYIVRLFRALHDRPELSTPPHAGPGRAVPGGHDPRRRRRGP